jgi:hypothetical protein
VIRSLILLNLAGGDCVEDLNVLEAGEGLSRLMVRFRFQGMNRRQRREEERRWGLSDFPWPFIIGLRWTSRCGLASTLCPQATMRSPGSRARCFRTCSGSSTAQGSSGARATAPAGVTFRATNGVGTLEFRNFAA